MHDTDYREGEIGESSALGEGRGGNRKLFLSETFRHKFFALSFSSYNNKEETPLRLRIPFLYMYSSNNNGTKRTVQD